MVQSSLLQRNNRLKERPADSSDVLKNDISEVMSDHSLLIVTVRPFANDIHYIAKHVHPHEVT